MVLCWWKEVKRFVDEIHPLVAHVYGWNLVLWTDGEKGFVDETGWTSSLPPVCSRRRARHARDCCCCCCRVSRELRGSSPSLARSLLGVSKFHEADSTTTVPNLLLLLATQKNFFTIPVPWSSSLQRSFCRGGNRRRDRETEEMASFGFFACIEQSTVGMVEKWGRFSHVAQPGLHCLNPFLGEWMAGRLSLRVQSLDVRCDTKTKVRY